MAIGFDLTQEVTESMDLCLMLDAYDKESDEEGYTDLCLDGWGVDWCRQLKSWAMEEYVYCSVLDSSDEELSYKGGSRTPGGDLRQGYLLLTD
jgi:hypothetical protein